MLSLHRDYSVLCVQLYVTQKSEIRLSLSHSKSLSCSSSSSYLKNHLQYTYAPAGDTGAVFIAAFSSQ